MARTVTLTVNGVEHTAEVEPRTLLVHFLREQLGLTGTHVGCDTSNCGACTVRLDGEAVKSCTVLAVQADGREVTTIEGISRDGELHPVQQAFHEQHGLQCGYCTPGMVMAAIKLLEAEPEPHRRRDPRTASRATCAAAPATRTSSPSVRAAAEGVTGDGQRDRHFERRSASRSMRKEDAELLTGEGRYVDDIKLPGMLHMAIVRSPYAHAKITSIDSSRGARRRRRDGRAHRRRPDLRGRRSLRVQSRPAACAQPDAPALATDRVRHLGEPVAVVVATDRYAARDARRRWSTSTTSRCRP